VVLLRGWSPAYARTEPRGIPGAVIYVLGVRVSGGAFRRDLGACLFGMVVMSAGTRQLAALAGEGFVRRRHLPSELVGRTEAS
jgi:hypothetical protein